ncbi:MAG: phenylacetic acid degradation operon negative regulatory protein PaaX [Proteobacteria bacterium]|nr:phenylacetic acid degradation operon negative regulatory protein PaaX [Pseudomonadota bacterium]TDJ32621.1 MAG: phenylacetic acid degradation operon negative regulatory protein PaaX [Gammaproteobacteria bacterium]
MTIENSARVLLDEFRSRPTMRAGSLIITVFGDAVLPRGGVVWIGSLIRVLGDFGVSERLVRTSVFRLTRDNWLDVNPVGRRSYYSLTEDGVRRFEQATQRIYGEPRQSWSGDWCLVLLAELDAGQKETVRKELGWLGFGAISPNVLAHPSPAMSDLERTLKQIGIERDLVVMRGRTLGKNQDDAMRALVHKSWNLDEIDRRYGEFITQFRPVFRAVEKFRKADGRTAFQIRTLMIQEYRRILLRDPLLPAEMLPAGWHGTAAYQLCRNLYRLIFSQADDFMSNEFETANGPLPPPAPEFYDRFGGLN